MSDNHKEKDQVESQPVRSLPMPEYRYQKDDTPSGFVDCSKRDASEEARLDLSQVSLNFAV